MCYGNAVDYDAIIIGAGHNGLILQAYLCRAGLKVLSLERLEVAGGGLSTVEDPRNPGFWHNTHAFFHRAITAMPWYADLGLEAKGAEYIEPALNVAMVLADGRTIQWWTDPERTADSFAAINRRDAATLKRWHAQFVGITETILRPEAMAPPLPVAERRALLERSAAGRRLLEVAALSPLEFVRREFEDPAIQAGLLFFNGLREVDPRVRGFGHHIAMLLASPAKAQMCRGGAAALARALLADIEEHGGTVRCGTVPRSIMIEDGRAAGVVLRDGEVIRSGKLVASSLDPHQTFLGLIEADQLPAPWRDAAAGFRYNLIAPLFAINLCLSEPPAYAAAERHPELAEALMVILGLDHVEQYPDLIGHHEAGTIGDPVMWGAAPTVFDPTQAPPGRHTAFMWEKVPYALGGDPAHWDAHKQTHGQRMLDHWRSYAPNLAEAVIDWSPQSPLDIERRFPNMRRGDLLIGAFTDGQIGHDRPFPGAGSYRGHVAGLYLCGSSSHPGGNITGLPGYNAAQVVLSDLGIAADWLPPPIADRLAGLATPDRPEPATEPFA